MKKLIARVCTTHDLDLRIAVLAKDINAKLEKFPSLTSFKKTLGGYDESISFCKKETEK